MTEGMLVAWKKKAGRQGVVRRRDRRGRDRQGDDGNGSVRGRRAVRLVPEGTKVAVGEKIAVMQGKGEAAARQPRPAPRPTTKQPVPAAEKAAAQAARDVSPATAEPAPTASGQRRIRRRQQPSGSRPVRWPGRSPPRRAYPLGGLTGTGPGGRIVQKDVLAAASESRRAGHDQPGAHRRRRPPPQPTPKAAAPPRPPPRPVPRARRPAAEGNPDLRSPGCAKPLPTGCSRARRRSRISTCTSRSMPRRWPGCARRSTPPARRTESRSASTISSSRRSAAAIARVPKVNASFAGDSVVEFSSVNLAVAVAVEDGLVTPVVQDAQAKSLAGDQFGSEGSGRAGRVPRSSSPTNTRAERLQCQISARTGSTVSTPSSTRRRPRFCRWARW